MGTHEIIATVSLESVLDTLQRIVDDGSPREFSGYAGAKLRAIANDMAMRMAEHEAALGRSCK